MSDFVTVSEAARILEQTLGVSVRPRTLSDLFYRREFPDTLAPIVGGRRLIPRDSLPSILNVLKRRGELPDDEQD